MNTENYYPITFEGDEFLVVNNGTAPTPCKITVIPQVDIVVLTIEGVSEKPITTSHLNVGDVLVIDGENRNVTINDIPAFKQYGGWEFPKLKPGENKIKVSNGAQTQLSVEFNARYI